MKKITLSLFMLATSFFVGAQTITQSTSQEIIQNTVACSNQGVASANSYFRAFDLSSYQITDTYNVSSVQFGVESIITGSTYPITVKLYATTATFPVGFPGANYTLVTEQVYNVPDQALSIYSAPITGSIPLGSDLVVEISYPDAPEGSTVDNATVFLGSNDAGETAPTYIMAAGCNILTPTPLTAVAEGVNLVMNVVGTQGTASISDFANNTVALYPNPANDVLNIKLANNTEINSASIADISGKQFSATVVSGSVNVSGIAPGVYFLTVNTAQGSVTKKFVKK